MLCKQRFVVKTIIENLYSKQLTNTLITVSCVLLFVLCTNIIHAQSYGDTILSISTDEIRYYPGQDVVLSGHVYGVEYPAIIKIDYTFNNQSIYHGTILTDEHGAFTTNTANLIEPGVYKITATINMPNQNLTSHTTVNVIHSFWNMSFLFIVLSTVNLILLISYLIFTIQKNITTTRIVEFGFISGMVLSILMVFVVTDVHIGANSPIGLISTSGQWVVNIGGVYENDYSSGLQIPVFVVIFGLVGGYLRVIYNIARPDLRKDTNNMTDFEKATADIATVFLSPLLAISLWFLMSHMVIQNSIFVMAIVSISVGLISDHIINLLEDFIRKIINSITTQKNN